MVYDEDDSFYVAEIGGVPRIFHTFESVVVAVLHSLTPADEDLSIQSATISPAPTFGNRGRLELKVSGSNETSSRTGVVYMTPAVIEE